MSQLLRFSGLMLLIGAGLFQSCQKELTCETCAGIKSNLPPVSIAGPDQTIILPVDSASLSGKTSFDPDGTIILFKWKNVSGPGSNILLPDTSETQVSNLGMGVYLFELTVKDNGGLFAKDTIQITVDDPLINQPPIACAGSDKVITLPVNNVLIDGNCSLDPDNDILSYAWTKVSGPSSFTLVNATSVQTAITNMVEGLYKFELKVTDPVGLTSKDTMQITVNQPSSSQCESSARPVVNAQLQPIGTLSQSRFSVSVVSAGNKIFFAGGSIWPMQPFASTRVDIFDVSNQTWSTSELSTPRWQVATIAAGNKVFFAGGGYYDASDNGISSDVVDIFDITSNQWTTGSLTGQRHNVAAATVGDKVFFAGGRNGDFLDSMSNKVDIFNLTSNSWSSALMSEGRDALTAATANNKIYFAGGISGWRPLPNGTVEFVASKKIDVYDNATNAWSTTFLTEGKYYFAGIGVGDNIYWAGGVTGAAGNPNSCQVEITNVNTQNSSFHSLSRARNFFVDGGQNAVLRNNQIVFFTGERWSQPVATNKFDIFDIATNSWMVGVLPQNLQAASIISVNNIIYLTDGLQVWKLVF